ncbi:MAG: RcnB family protein [Propionivibrio sp.]|jgi:Ni/Co efflux regulator RcnB|uniref:RcnB family protein n=1 Tax=Propionivibrio sp. TaxID=2212460 RepID=UPI001B670EBB|nr:RcnB family protein [Propionivibrio sp.]MBP7201887.1 RcnB family protein [Propionivibrio sp.]
METRKHAPLAALAVALMLALSPLGALAEKGGKHNKDKGNNGHKNGDNGGTSVSVEFRFGDSDRRAVQEYYQSPARGKGCPPGLAKKGNGCMPPGQARKWARGRPLPHDLVVYDLPRDLRYRLPPPPAGHRYVQLGADVLMIAVGTSMVVDAIEDMVR